MARPPSIRNIIPDTFCRTPFAVVFLLSMPFRAIRLDGTSVLAIDCNDQQWTELKRSIRHAPNGWRLPCCDSQVVAKTSSAGLKFFAHKARGSCESAPETKHHVRLKHLAVLAARDHGWSAETEVPGKAPNGDSWVADVLARRGSSRVAIEIQWSGQTKEELLARQERYARSGVRALWLIKSTMFPVIKELPAVCIREASPGRYDAFIPGSDYGRSKVDRIEDWAYRLRVELLLDAAFSGNLRWGVKKNEELTYRVWAATTRCWRCRAWTSPVTSIEVLVSETPVFLTVSGFTKTPRLLDRIIPTEIRKSNKIGKLKVRFSKTEGSSYMSNGCISCDALQGRFFEHEYANSSTIRHSGIATVDDVWLRLLTDRLPHHWRIVGLRPLNSHYDDSNEYE